MLFTIGYEKSELQDFIQTVRAAGVEVLVDIRDRAQSRRKGFSKTALAAALNEAGIEYIHYRELGDPKEGREAARAGDFERFKTIYSAVLKSDEAQAALSKLESLAQEHAICLLCYERDHRECHRKMVADSLKKRINVAITHLGVQPIEARRAA
ncbi:conserved hypothetical protein [Oceanicaulis sp. 350]|nr:conserved hypothetical protein [Oceanicaulis sp. 350]